MFPSSNSFQSSSSGSGQEQRSPFQPYSHSHSVQYNGSPFNVAGMTSLNQSRSGAGQNGPASPSMRGAPLGSLGDSLSQPRSSHYQAGYLMSGHQGSSSPPMSREDPPILQTKAKLLNNTFSGDVRSEFGMDSMFESSRQRARQTLADEDAPPTASVDDIVNEIPESIPSRISQRSFEPSHSRASLFRSTIPLSTPKQPASTPQQNTQPVYVIVFGYPPDKYSVTVEYFRSLGETTKAEQSSELLNCFRIGYLNPAEAIRAVRKNGEILSGSWMVGAKWADASQAEALLGIPFMRSAAQSPDFMSGSPEVNIPSPSANVFGPTASLSRMSVDELVPRNVFPRAEPSTPAVGIPIKLAPSASAFRRPGAGTPSAPPAAVQSSPLFPASASSMQQSPSKGVLGQVSDLIFGW